MADKVDEAIVDVIASMEGWDSKDIADRLRTLIDSKIYNEALIAKLLGVAVKNDLFNVQECIALMAKGKDGIVELGKYMELMAGRATERVELTVEERAEL